MSTLLEKQKLAASIASRIRVAEDLITTLESNVRIVKHELLCLHKDLSAGLEILELEEPIGDGVYASGVPKDKPPSN